MNYHELINNIKEIALKNPNIKSVYSGDVYNNWNTHKIEYGSLNINLESTNRTNNTIIYNIVLYYGDRLMEDKSNSNSITNNATIILNFIISDIDNSFSYEPPLNIIPFEQNFADYLAGAYVRVGLETEYDEGNCGDSEPYETRELYITSNGNYDIRTYDLVNVNIPEPAKKEEELNITILENVTKIYEPTQGNVYNKVTVSTNIKSYKEEYEAEHEKTIEQESTISQQVSTINSLITEITNLDLKVKGLENNVTELENTIQDKNTKISELYAEIENLNNSLDDKNTQIII